MTEAPGGEVAAPAFVHDLNACVGCHACVLACRNENDVVPPRSWRQIVTVNPERWPGHPTFHLSLACNHCLDAPCLRHCPARAISRHQQTGAVLIDEASCIGCRYCGWVCPYDAPRFDEREGVMTKCTFCAHRLAEALEPACVQSCPTGALRLGRYHAQGVHEVPGLPRAAARPAMSFVPLRARGVLAQAGGDAVAQADVLSPEATRGEGTRLTLSAEWPLVVFSFAAAGLVAWLAAALAGAPPVPPPVAVALGAGAMATSTLHLGRPRRAWRAVLNWRSSWLSREVISFPLLLACVAAQWAAPMVGWPHLGPWFDAAGLAAGVACLVSIDQVYAAMARRGSTRADRLTSVLSAAFMAAALLGWPRVWLMLGVARVGGSVARCAGLTAPGGLVLRLALARLVVGIGAAGACWALGARGWMLVAVAAGELLDRLHFYASVEVVTPKSEAARALLDPRARMPARLVAAGAVSSRA